jgi:hypothetical protein
VLNHSAKVKKLKDSDIFQEIMEKVAVPIINNTTK